jgi:hypothetical protein
MFRMIRNLVLMRIVQKFMMRAPAGIDRRSGRAFPPAQRPVRTNIL